MGVLALINHGINFLAPAVWLALLLPLVSRYLIKNKPLALALSVQAALLFAVGATVLTLGLVLFGRDGKMLTYLALVLTLAAAQAFVSRR